MTLKFIASLLVCLSANIAAQQSKYQYTTVPIDLETNHLPAFYVGHSPYAIVSNLINREKRLKKGEFETSDEFAQRIHHEKMLPVIGAVNLNDVFAFYYDDFGLSYLADDAKYQLSLFDSAKYLSQIDVNLTTQTKKYGSFVGQNAFGVKKRVQVVREANIQLKLSWDRYYDNDLFFAVERSKAIRIKNSIRVLLLVKLHEPFVEINQNVETATIDDPRLVAYHDISLRAEYVGVIIYNIENGEILHRNIRKKSLPLIVDLPKEPREKPAGIEYEKGLRPSITVFPKAAYTESGRKKGIEGKVRLNVLFLADGTIPVSEINVLQGLPEGLTEKAIEAARKIQFEPPIKDGKKVNTRVTLEYEFSLYRLERNEPSDSSPNSKPRPRIP
jgi:TonB family protein